MKCSMQCGSCKNDATLVARTGGKMLDYLNLGTLGLTKQREPKRTLYACARHRDALERCVEYYGGGPVKEVGV